MDPEKGRMHSVFCVWLPVVFSCIRADLAPYFTAEPLSTIQKLGGRVQLRCAAEPAWAHITWHFNGKKLTDGEQNGIAIQFGSLTISHLQRSHVGRYLCVASSSVGAVVSRPSSVTVASISDFQAPSQRVVTVDEGSTGIIECRLPDSKPQALIRYRVKGKWFEQSTDKYLILPSGNLHILNVTQQDKGSYKCAAYNPVTNEMKMEPTGRKLLIRRPTTSSAHIIYPTTPQNITVIQHSPLILECAVSGIPTPRVKWLKDGRELSGNKRWRLFHHNLVVDQSKMLDAGSYLCIAENGMGEPVSANYTVIVHEPAAIVKGLQELTLSVGSTARLTCDYHGNPWPNITWYYNAVTIQTGVRYLVSGNRLKIVGLVAEDAGMYQCVVENKIGSTQSSARLIVQSDQGTKPVITSPPTNLRVTEGEFVTLTCNATGQPTPIIRWFDRHGLISNHPSHILRSKSRNGQLSGMGSPSSNTPHLTMTRAGSSSLYIRIASLESSGVYICEASNKMGSVQAEAFLSVVPFETKVRVDDQEPTQSARSSDIVQGDEGDETIDYDYVFDIMSPEHQPTKESISPEPTQKTPPDAPIILSAPYTTNPDSYDLIWRAGKDGGSPINAYFVKYRKLDNRGNMLGNWHTIRVPGSENELQLAELEPSSLYEVLMVARSASGEGQPAMLTFRTGKGRSSTSKKNSRTPSQPVGVPKQTPVEDKTSTNFGVVIHDLTRHSRDPLCVVWKHQKSPTVIHQQEVPPFHVPEAPDRPTISTASETSVYVTWIPRANGGSPITSFNVEYKRIGRNSDWLVAANSISPSKLSVEVRGLEPGAAYKFRVIAINAYGESPRSAASRPYQVAGFSNPFSARPIAGPHIAHTEAVTDTQIMLKWTYIPSSNNNTPIQGFYIYYRPTDSDNDSDYKRDVVEGNKQWHLIRHLQPETSYDIKMQCFNEGGESEFSNVMICETKARRSLESSEYSVVMGDDISTQPNLSDHQGGGHGASTSGTRSNDMLYLIVGSVLGIMVLILIIFIAMCLWKNRQQTTLQKYDPPNYLYQGQEVNGQLMEYTTLPGTSRINGSIHGSYIGNGSLSNGCPHLHHKLSNGVNGLMNGGINGGTAIYPNQTNSLQRAHMDYDQAHHIMNGGGIYTALPQTEPSECINCRNCRNNNSRCFTKTNGTFPSSNLPMIQRTPACHQDSMEMMPLNHIIAPLCSGSIITENNREVECDNTKASAPPTPPQDSCCSDLDQSYEDKIQDGKYPELETENQTLSGIFPPFNSAPIDCDDPTAWSATQPAEDNLCEHSTQEQLRET
ncbi:cell adhesion molecule-related/down-regulated by oncogenes isoform X1 [Chiloscyllium plagiosum]|uniref:cell adhesion molecule-related/down-regulated by oncogenes isoform X1 n=1 Tax=Chiloscyllium plagiosum TaxID=36176 RepID=UPI001CB7C096|nr:cell adhesion molecule-related/down-regulated by oncogenes isoform X1 [Chiloscyllium plagiosum]